MSELKPCPFCGGVRLMKVPQLGGACVECMTCHARGPVSISERYVTGRWNKGLRRVYAKGVADREELAGENEHLRKSLSRMYELVDSYSDSYEDLEHSYERLRRVHETTAEHLRKTRERLRTATCQIEGARISGKFFRGKYYELMDDLHGDEEPVDVPEHYRGDCVVSAARALRSATAQPTKAERTETAFYWWALAFKYVWRLWSKGQAERDAEKAIDCLKRVIGEIDHE